MKFAKREFQREFIVKAFKEGWLLNVGASRWYQGVQVWELLPKHQPFLEAASLSRNSAAARGGEGGGGGCEQFLTLLSVDNFWGITWQHLGARDPGGPKGDSSRTGQQFFHLPYQSFLSSRTFCVGEVEVKLASVYAVLTFVGGSLQGGPCDPCSGVLSLASSSLQYLLVQNKNKGASYSCSFVPQRVKNPTAEAQVAAEALVQSSVQHSELKGPALLQLWLRFNKQTRNFHIPQVWL